MALMIDALLTITRLSVQDIQGVTIRDPFQLKTNQYIKFHYVLNGS